MLVLAEDGESLLLYALDSFKEPEGAFYLNAPCEAIYWTPIEEGSAVLYYIQKDRKLCFSQSKTTGRLEDVSASDQFSFKLDFEETVTQCLWNGDKVAVATSMRVLILDADLKLLKAVKAVAVSLCWCGSCLFFSTGLRVLYCTLKSPVECVLHCEKEAVIAGVLPDRLILAQNGSVFTTRPLLLTEPLIKAVLEDPEVDLSALVRAATLMETPLVSDGLISALLVHKQVKPAWHLLQSPSQMPHLSLILRVRTMWFLKKYAAIIEILTQHVTSDAVDAVHDYNYKLERKLMEKLAPQLERVGQLQLAGRCYALTRNFEELLRLVLQLGSLTAEEHSDLAVRLGQGSVVKVPKVSEVITLDRCELENLPISEVADLLERRKAGYGETLFLVETTAHEELCTPVAENLGQFLGYSSLFNADFNEAAQHKAYIPPMTINRPTGQRGAIDGSAGKFPQEIAEAAELTEEEILVAYLHCDEGRGPTISDVVTGKTWDVDPEIWGDQILDGEPLEREDKWGKAAPPAYALETSSNCKLSLVDLSDRAITPFCIEAWVRPYSPDGTLFTFLPNKLVLSVLNLRLYVHDRSIPLEAAVTLQTWQHIALSYEDQRVSLYLNGALVSTIEEQMPGFSDLVVGEGYEGSFTEVRIWKKPRTQAELAENMHGPLEILSEKRKKKWAAIKISKTSNAIGGKLAHPSKLNPLAKPPLPGPAPAGPRLGLLKPPGPPSGVFKPTPVSSARFRSSFEEDKEEESAK
jgi:hypothetical protein